MSNFGWTGTKFAITEQLYVYMASICTIGACLNGLVTVEAPTTSGVRLASIKYDYGASAIITSTDGH